MTWMSYFLFFFKSIFSRKTRSWALFIAIGGPTLATMALFVLQSVMAGLQKNLVERSKQIEGHSIIYFQESSLLSVQKMHKILSQKKILHFTSFEKELLITTSSSSSPIFLIGIDSGLPPHFLHSFRGQTILGSDLAKKLHLQQNHSALFVAPVTQMGFMEEIPRERAETISDVIQTEIPDVDQSYGWTRASFLQSLYRERTLNTIRIHQDLPSDVKSTLLKDLRTQVPGTWNFQTWEERNESLVWALALEQRVMLFLFVAMTLLISVAIGTGFHLYFEKMKLNLTGLWLMGTSMKDIFKQANIFLHLLAILTSTLGLFLGFILLQIIKVYGKNVMPDVFVERHIPVYLSWKSAMISWGIPYLISFLFSYSALKYFRKSYTTFVIMLRAKGQ
jgi:lipoprotein-releasing system permease protein